MNNEKLKENIQNNIDLDYNFLKYTNEMYEKMGNELSKQYGGSMAHN